jgi:hypothetical protein
VAVFFESLDGELNKVNQFYKNKESEFLERGEILNKQLETLQDLKLVLNEHRRKPINAGVLPLSCSSSPPRNSFCSGNGRFSFDIKLIDWSRYHEIETTPFESTWRLMELGGVS